MSAPKARYRSMSKRGDEGSALLDAVFIIACLFVPLIWMAIALIHAEGVAYAARTAAREGARTFVTSASSGEAARRAEVAANLVFDDEHVPRGEIHTACSANPCLTPGASVSVTTEVREPLPFIPRFLAGTLHLEVAEHSVHTEKVEQYGGMR